jgi:hypothetical protein
MLPYRKPKQLKIEIDTPDSRDSGQIVCLWKKALDLVELLEKPPGFIPWKFIFETQKTQNGLTTANHNNQCP